ncbi:uncharacterized protein LOC128652334 [Bombina bombina]|uniref:uncharacterized protein LOC128652334 n=1 Tax=Bombina bombina TaxID=8345 RepID=UPI00235A82F7|nr:uncharacterized protein LOC128652334 [Bombina bombina]
MTNTDPRATGFQNTEKVTAASQGVQSAVTQDPSTGVRIVWVMGHSFIYWANAEASKKMGGLQLGCPVDQWEVKWFGIRGMCWELLFPLFLDYGRMFPRPHVLIVHLGGNDLGMIPQKELVRRIKRDLGNIKELYPGIKIICPSSIRVGSKQFGVRCALQRIFAKRNDAIVCREGKLFIQLQETDTEDFVSQRYLHYTIWSLLLLAASPHITSNSSYTLISHNTPVKASLQLSTTERPRSHN